MKPQPEAKALDKLYLRSLGETGAVQAALIEYRLNNEGYSMPYPEARVMAARWGVSTDELHKARIWVANLSPEGLKIQARERSMFPMERLSREQRQQLADAVGLWIDALINHIKLKRKQP